jgi:8-oxo-dGTP pyrophosphatase MutT (NUDIX family)
MKKNKSEKINPWITLSSREIYKNEWLRLREDQVVTPGGKRGIYSVIEKSPAIAIVPLTKNQETYLIGQYRYALNTYSWEIPEGGADSGESNLEAAKRELKEETGLEALQWTYLESLYTSNSVMNEVGHIYLAEDLTEGDSEPEHTEDLSVIKIPFMDLYQKVLDYEIKDALAIIGVMRVYEYLKANGRM